MQNVLTEWRNFLVEHEDDVNAAAGILLFNDKGEVLLSKRSSTVSNPLTIGTIGGHLTKGESPEEGAKREFWEEAGHKGPFHDMMLLTKQSKPDGFRYYSFLARIEDDKRSFEPQKEYQDEIVWNKWIPFKRAITINNLHPGLAQIFNDPVLVTKMEKYINANKEPEDKRRDK